jgi:hypothetical protein
VYLPTTGRRTRPPIRQPPRHPTTRDAREKGTVVAPTEPIAIVAAPGAEVSRLVHTLSWVPADLPKWALVGGFAVVVGVGSVHRATIDLDCLTRQPDELLDQLVKHGAERRDQRCQTPTGIGLNVIDVGTIGAATETKQPIALAGTARGRNPRPAGPSREYVTALALDWAFETSTVQTVNITDPVGVAHASATLHVATVSALMALKVMAIPPRSENSNPARAISDTLDLLALAQAEPLDDIVAVLDTAPLALQEQMATTCQRVFVDELRYTEARLRATRANVAPGAIALLARLSARLG